MAVYGLDHVNILTADLDGTKRFYKSLLGLEEAIPPEMPAGIVPHWLVDSSGQAIIHLQKIDAEGAENSTGSIHHVALRCEDYEGVQARCEEMGLPYMANNFEAAKIRQIFVTDPNNVRLEMNFAG